MLVGLLWVCRDCAGKNECRQNKCRRKAAAGEHRYAYELLGQDVCLPEGLRLPLLNLQTPMTRKDCYNMSINRTSTVIPLTRSSSLVSMM